MTRAKRLLLSSNKTVPLNQTPSLSDRTKLLKEKEAVRGSQGCTNSMRQRSNRTKGKSLWSVQMQRTRCCLVLRQQPRESPQSFAPSSCWSAYLFSKRCRSQTSKKNAAVGSSPSTCWVGARAAHTPCAVATNNTSQSCYEEWDTTMSI